MGQKKKILYIITKSNWGGAQRYVYDLATRLPKDGFETVVACGGEGELVARLRDAHVRVIPLPTLTNEVNTRIFPTLLRIIKTESPDILHLNSSKVGILGSIAGRIVRVPRIIFTAHGWAFNEDRGSLARFVIKMIHYATIMLSHATIAVSRSMNAQIKPRFLKKKMILIYNGLSPISFLAREEARRTILDRTGIPIPEYTFWIGTIAELHPSKGLSFAIDAMESVPDATYIIIGDGKERDRLESLVREKKLTGRVFFSGRMDNAARFLRAFDIFLFPSITEALGYALLEAGFAGLPAVAAYVGGIPEIIQDGKTGILVPPKNPNAITEAISTLMKDKKRATEYGARLSDDIQRRFSIEKMVNKTIKIYRNEEI